MAVSENPILDVKKTRNTADKGRKAIIKECFRTFVPLM